MKTGRWMHVILAVAAAAAVMMSAFLAGCGGSDDVFIGGLNLPTEMTIVSNAPDGTAANGHSYRAAMSADGRYVAFDSVATTLVDDYTIGWGDVYVRDLVSNSIQIISNAPDGSASDDEAYDAAMSADGRYVVFASWATNLVASDTNGQYDIFVRDMQTGTTTLVSNAADGTESNNSSLHPSISADGRYVAFDSSATNLVADDTNGMDDVFVRDLLTGTTVLVSNTADGTMGDYDSSAPAISADGRYVAFDSAATTLVAGDTNGLTDVFVRDMQTGTMMRVSSATDYNAGNQGSYRASISADGRYVAFYSKATNLVASDTNGQFDVFVRDLLSATTVLVSNAVDGSEADNGSFDPTISANGRYVAFHSRATNLVAGDSNGLQDAFVRDLLTTTTVLVSNAADGTAANTSSFSPALSADGRHVSFDSSASTLVTGDSNGARDVFFTPVKW